MSTTKFDIFVAKMKEIRSYQTAALEVYGGYENLPETIKKEFYETPTMTVIGVKVDRAILTVSGEAAQYEGPYEF